MNYNDVLQKARACIDTAKCKACPVCNGLACRNTIPGPGAKGVGDTAIRNYQKWQDIRVQMDTLHENKPVDMSVQLFGHKFSYPFFAGPVSACIMAMLMTNLLIIKFWFRPAQKMVLPLLRVTALMRK